jgi:diketogulonate reductase-like aldo/keto reductase
LKKSSFSDIGCTKVAAEAKTYDAATKSIDESLAKLGLDYIDLLIIHSPQPWMEFREENRYFEENKKVWKSLEDAYKKTVHFRTQLQLRFTSYFRKTVD